MTPIEQKYSKLEKKAEEVLKTQGISLEDLKRDMEIHKKVTEGLKEYNEIINQLEEFNKMMEALRSFPNGGTYTSPKNIQQISSVIFVFPSTGLYLS